VMFNRTIGERSVEVGGIVYKIKAKKSIIGNGMMKKIKSEFRN